MSEIDRNFDKIHAAALEPGELLDHLESRIRALYEDGEITFWVSEDDSIVVDFANEQVQLEAPTLRELLQALSREPTPIKT